MNVNINFYGRSVEINAKELAEELGNGATLTQIRRAVNEAVDKALHEEEFPHYYHDGSDVVDEVYDLCNPDEDDDAGE